MRYIFLLFIIVVLLSMCMYPTTGSAADMDLRASIAELRAEIADLEAKLTKQKVQRKVQRTRVEEAVPQRQIFERHVDPHVLHRREGYQITDGLRIGAGATFILQSAIDANNVDTFAGSSDSQSATDASYSVDVEIEKEFDDYGLAFIHLETGDGAGVEGELEVFSNVNRDADDSDNTVDVTEVWYEHRLYDDQFTLRAGKVDPTIQVDQNEIAHDETTQFLGRVFRNSPTIDFPDNSVGVYGRFSFREKPWIEADFQIVDGDNDWEDITNDLFSSWQVNFKPGWRGRDGNCRIYAWFKNTEYTKWKDTSSTKRKKWGFGTSIDQRISDTCIVFGRYGWTDPDVYDPNITSSSSAVYSLQHAVSIGCQFDGQIWGRRQDKACAAFAMVVPSDEFKDSSDVRDDSENHIELYYSWVVNDHVVISPDLQIIWNPFGSGYIVSNVRRDDVITVFGCRAQVDL